MRPIFLPLSSALLHMIRMERGRGRERGWTKRGREKYYRQGRVGDEERGLGERNIVERREGVLERRKLPKDREVGL